jgi:hypothetical protein
MGLAVRILIPPAFRPETREEMIDGRLVLAPPALEPHAEQHYELDYVTRGGVAPGYIGATDLLTRTGTGTQFAADTCNGSISAHWNPFVQLCPDRHRTIFRS